MKIFISSTGYPPYVSGVATATANLAQTLALHHQVTVLSSTTVKKPHTQIINSNLTLHLFPGINFKKRANLTIPYPYPKKIKNLILSIQPDVIHLQDFSPLGLSALALANEIKIPAVITHHFTAEFVFKTIVADKRISNLLCQNSTTKQLIYWLANLIYNKSQLLTVPNPQLIPLFKTAGLKTPIISIPNGIITKNFQFKTDFAKLKQQYHLTGSKYILFVGRLDSDKNLEILINAFKLVTLSHPKLNLLIVGEGNQQTALARQIKKLKLNSSTFLLGKIDNQTKSLSHLYNAASVFVNPSIIENQSVSFIEAFSAGLPIVAANHPLQTDFIKDQVNGLLAKPNNPISFAQAIEQILLNPNLASVISQNNRLKAKDFDINKTSRQYLQAYRSLL